MCKLDREDRKLEYFFLVGDRKNGLQSKMG